MTEIEAWKFIADMIPGSLYKLKSVYCLRYPIRGQWFQDFGLCNVVFTMWRHSLISQQTCNSMADRLKEENHNCLVLDYLWDLDWSGWNQRKEFCLKQIQKLIESGSQVGFQESVR